MDSCLWYYFLTSIFHVTIIADIGSIRTIDVQQDERIRLECTVTSKLDAEEAMWMRIRPPHNPDILTYRDGVVYAPDRIQLEQHLSPNINANGTAIDTHFLTLTILRPNLEDEGRYVCSRGRNIFAEYDLFIIVPPQFVDDNSFIQRRTIVEGLILHLSCSAVGRPKPSITWFSRTNDRKHVPLLNGTSCQNTICELQLGNYSRNDPTIIECVADNEKSTRISKVFHVDVHYPPKVTTKVETFPGSRSINVLLQCASISNPPAVITWLDNNKHPINNSHIYDIKKFNQSSTLSFSIYAEGHSSFVFYCHSNNSIGTNEKLINISNIIQLDSITIRETTTTTIQSSTSRSTRDFYASRKQKTVRPSRAQTRPATSTMLVSTTTITSSNNMLYSFSNNLFYSIISLFVICFV